MHGCQLCTDHFHFGKSEKVYILKTIVSLSSEEIDSYRDTLLRCHDIAKVDVANDLRSRFPATGGLRFALQRMKISSSPRAHDRVARLAVVDPLSQATRPTVATDCISMYFQARCGVEPGSMTTRTHSHCSS